jgi:acyl carrier protein
MKNKRILNNKIKILKGIMNKNYKNLDKKKNFSSLKEWDSLKHLNLYIEIEQKLKIKFNLKEMERITNYESLINILTEKIK